MRHAHFKLILAIFAFAAAILTVPSICLSSDMAYSACGYYGGGNCSVFQSYDRCCSVCDKVCQFRAIDGCTKCAWSRTWHGPNALATPLSQYYIPRPPQCCCYNGCAGSYGNSAGPTWETPASTDCQDRMTLAGSEVSPEAAAGFSPAQFERLGRIRNELDVVGPIGGPTTGRAAAPTR
jgi:hypothetical protein